MRRLIQTVVRHWLCTLCLRQREVYWVSLALAASGVVVSHVPRVERFTRFFGVALALVFLTGCAIAVYHAGAEWKWWPGPTTCSGAGGAVSAAAMASLLHGAKISAPHCDEAAWRFLGLSMAGWNALISLKLAFWSAVFAAAPAWTRADD